MSKRNSSAVLRRQKDLKRGIRFTVMVCGCAGTGKTSFVNSLLDRNILPHRYQYHKPTGEETIRKTITFANLSGVVSDATEYERVFDPEVANQEPGISITETSVEILDEDDSKLLLTIIDTPGFGDNINNEVCATEIINFLEQQFDLVLAEETRVRRNPRFVDTRVHVCLYFITPTGHGLRELDVDTMKKLSKFVNVIPVIGRADSFTKTELLNFKRNIMQDIDHHKIPIYQFEYEADDDDDVVEENRYLSEMQPFAVITSDDEAEINGVKTRVRTYPWGSIDINNTEYSDFPVLKSVLLGSHLQDLKDITHDFLYENYRTEKLMSVTNLEELHSAEAGGIVSEPPSMSNLADIANSKSMAKFDAPSQRISSMLSTGTTGTTKITKDNKVDSVASKLSATSLTEPPEIIKGKPESDYSFQKDDELASLVDDKDETPVVAGLAGSNPATPTTTPRLPHSASVSSQYSGSPSINARQLRKISETVPYLLKHETLMSKHQKLEELERKSAQELAKRAAELEKKAMELKQREKMLKEQLAKKEKLLVKEEPADTTADTASFVAGDDKEQ
ncbi:hypothetical protein KL905_002457 [Ogataea polymorpha]|uniref:Uncharacterized protein n=1 Tax=Ogataea polymorpha TaxID=460523 RepID=A0A1B7SPQ3_9ASCO|nr:uncharacterized protein OGAPODRAFT_15217 [Ogataea polymorpha]KAG7880483.1 hypothetical protein KL937_002045 [Ogataea polymorpha]KAG7894685.1 hypothetical protein KL908_002057 [Ogataea polymorpha]KAG7899721.1 hypothetical protein KL935_003262 [Ogataea polymorpha]KAG7906561.1 hypothetical protein KL907_002201 [Ogataea polymorpha]KAG7909808.1 hypothetical protein KL906_001713 [Ogataea polymorpha]